MGLTEKVARAIAEQDEALCAKEFNLTAEQVRSFAEKYAYQHRIFARAAINVCAEEMAKVAEGETYLERYRTWSFWPADRDGLKGNRAPDSELVKHSDAIAAAIRCMGEKGE